MFVAINSDESIRCNKGEKRPIINENDRAKLIDALEYVDYVYVFTGKSLSDVIKRIKPDIVVKGVDWKDKILPEKDVIEEIGAKIEYVDLVDGLSTTSIISRIKDAYKGNDI